MRKKYAALILAFLTLVLFGCGKDSINPSDYIRLGEYKGLSATKPSSEVTDEMVEEKIKTVQAAYTEVKPVTDRTVVQDGDVVNIDFVGRHNGIAFEGGSAEDMDLTIGSHMLIDGFEDGLIGANVSDNVELNLRFPNVYPIDPSLAGEEVVFSVTINSISENIVPEITDEFINEKSMGEFTTVDAMREGFKKEMQKEAESYANSTMYSELLSKAIEGSVLIEDIPESFIEEKQAEMVRTMKSNAAAYHVTYETYLSAYLGMSEQQFMDTIKESSVEIAMQNLVIHAIADAENIKVSKDELNAKIDEYIEAYGYSSRSELEKNMNIDDIKESMLIVKVEEFLADNASITEE